MPEAARQTRIFRVHARHVDPHHAVTVRGPSFEAAAAAYLEHLHDLPAAARAIGVIVHDVESGRTLCFTLALESGETAPCL